MRVLNWHGFCLSFSLSILATSGLVPFVSPLASLAENIPGERAGRMLTPQLQAPALPSPALRVRVAVAQNTRTPKEILAKLAKDDSIMVRQAVAQNPSTPPEVIEFKPSQYLAAFLVLEGLLKRSARQVGLPVESQIGRAHV